MRKKTPNRSRYEVGYKRPPISTRFKPGNREWVKRRKAPKNSEVQLFRQLMSAAVKIDRNGAASYVGRMQMLVDNFVAAAVRGDLAAADLLLTMHARSKELGDLSPIILVLDAADAKL